MNQLTFLCPYFLFFLLLLELHHLLLNMLERQSFPPPLEGIGETAGVNSSENGVTLIKRSVYI